ncbi:MAG: hypothetical protein ACTS6P_00805 [Candidatus Hodgkinia cicadicola]
MIKRLANESLADVLRFALRAADEVAAGCIWTKCCAIALCSRRWTEVRFMPFVTTNANLRR